MVTDTFKVADAVQKLSHLFLIFAADIFGSEQVTIQDIKTLIKASEYNVDAIKKAFTMAKEQKFIGNLVGWMRSCLEEKWYENETLPKFKGRTVEESQMTLDLYQEYLEEKKQGK